ncbi:STT3 domain-containing protein [Methanobacterium sp.]|uniref:STT3 domain-containing protein n=1 Tax=Methanobacterium sp. TaxID=2164 RepID=UPI003C70D87F
MIKFIKKDNLVKLSIILLIFLIGFTIRADSIHLQGIPDDQKAFYEDQNGIPYMYEFDSYYNYRLTENYLDHGYLGDTVINGTEWDLHSYYPPGVPLDYPPLISYLTVFIYNLVNIFSQIPLLTVCFWIPAFIGPIAGIVAYLFVRRFTNEYGAFMAGILTVTAPLYLIRTVPGWFDTDIFNIIFPLLIVWFFIEAVESKNNRMQILFTFLSAFSMFLFSMAWNGWQYLFYIITIFCIVYLINGKIKGNNIRNILNVFISFFTVSIILISITNFSNILNFIYSPLQLIKISGNQSSWYPWPDLYISISELMKPSIEELFAKVGPVLFGLGIIGIFLILRLLVNNQLKERFLSRMSWFFYLLIVVWLLIGFVSLFKGIRFILLLMPPLIISAGIMVGISVEYINNLKGKLKGKEIFVKFLCLTFIIIISIPALFNAYESSSLVPGADDDLWNSATWIQNNTSNNTVVIIEWSYGHFFSAIADRPVTFDGRSAYIETMPLRQFYNNSAFNPQSPSTSREYWIDKAFCTSNESLAVGIFRMLSTGGDKGYLTLDKYTGNTSKSVEILNNILGVNKNSSMKILINNYKLSPEEAKEILKYTHPDNPNPFVIVTYDEMIYKAKWTFYFGEWNLNKNIGKNYTFSVGTLNITDSEINTDNNVTGNLKTNNITWNEKVPYCEIIVENNKIEKHYLNKNSDFCIFLLKDSNKSVVLDKRFENSMFAKLILEKSGSSNLKQVYRNRCVVIWK